MCRSKRKGGGKGNLTQTGTWSEFECGFGISSWWFGGMNGGEHLLGILRVMQPSLPQRLFSTHSWIRHNLQNKEDNHWVNAFPAFAFHLVLRLDCRLFSDMFIVYSWNRKFSREKDFLCIPAAVMQELHFLLLWHKRHRLTWWPWSSTKFLR